MLIFIHFKKFLQNITPLMNYDSFNGNYQGNEIQGFKEFSMLPLVLLAAGVGAFIILRRK